MVGTEVIHLSNRGGSYARAGKPAPAADASLDEELRSIVSAALGDHA